MVKGSENRGNTFGESWGMCDTLGVCTVELHFFIHHVLKLLEQGSYFKI